MVAQIRRELPFDETEETKALLLRALSQADAELVDATEEYERIEAEVKLHQRRREALEKCIALLKDAPLP